MKEYLLQITSPPMRITGLGILQPSQEAPINNVNSWASTAHAASDILWGGEFDTNTHSTTMSIDHNPGKTQKGEAYSSHYIEATSEYIEDRKWKMKRESQVGKWINILPLYCSHIVLGAHEFRATVILRY